MLHRSDTTLVARCTHADMKTSDMLDKVELSVLADGSSIERSTSSLLTYESLSQPGVPMNFNGKR